MKAKLLSALTVLPLIAGGVFLGANSTQAASITGPGEISINIPNLILEPIFDVNDLDGDTDVTELIGNTFNIDPNTNNATYSAGIDGFSGFNVSLPDVRGFQILDVNILQGLTTGIIVSDPIAQIPLAAVDNFMVIEGSDINTFNDGDSTNDFSFTLTKALLPQFTDRDDDTFVVDVTVEGFWEDGAGNKIFDGVGIYTAQFVNVENEGDFFNQLAAGELEPISASGTITSEEIVVPEPTTTLGAFLALGLGGLSFRKKKQQIG
jgi:hypothetical protein